MALHTDIAAPVLGSGPNAQGQTKHVAASKCVATNQNATPVEQSCLTPATQAEMKIVYTRLQEAIDTSPYYSEEFKQFERERLTPVYLSALYKSDPRHILIARDKGNIAGFMISGPDLGVLWLYWSYIFPEKRNKSLAMKCMRAFNICWNNDRFHKVATYTRPGNRVAELLMKRYGWKHTCTLENHIFGEDYELYERPLTKTSVGYDRGVGIGIMGRLIQKARTIFQR